MNRRGPHFGIVARVPNCRRIFSFDAKAAYLVNTLCRVSSSAFWFVSGPFWSGLGHGSRALGRSRRRSRCRSCHVYHMYIYSYLSYESYQVPGMCIRVLSCCYSGRPVLRKVNLASRLKVLFCVPAPANSLYYRFLYLSHPETRTSPGGYLHRV